MLKSKNALEKLCERQEISTSSVWFDVLPKWSLAFTAHTVFSCRCRLGAPVLTHGVIFAIAKGQKV